MIAPAELSLTNALEKVRVAAAAYLNAYPHDALERMRLYKALEVYEATAKLNERTNDDDH